MSHRPHSPSDPLYANPSAQTYTSPKPNTTNLVTCFHRTLPNFAPSPLIPLPSSLSASLNLQKVYLKLESSRLHLPSFKILGASWGTFCALTSLFNLPQTSKLEDLASIAQEAGIVLVAATDGNHGRAVARMARLLGLRAEIYVPGKGVDEGTKVLIKEEGDGVRVLDVEGDYDAAVASAAMASDGMKRILIQDTSFDGYEDIPRWIVEGYSTMMSEVDEQLSAVGYPGGADLIVTPVGVGSLAQAVVGYCKQEGRRKKMRILTVEPENAACLYQSLWKGRSDPIQTRYTIMAGMNCGTVSPIAWPTLQAGVDASVTVSEMEAHEAVVELGQSGIEAGPCGAATLAGLRKLASEWRDVTGLHERSVVVLLCTEGMREYEIPVA